jgi:spore coat protein A, manganese oxidase
VRFVGMSRRGFGRLAAGAGLASLVGCSGRAESAEPPGQEPALLLSQLPVGEPFRRPLPVPAVLRPVRTDGGTDYYEVVQRRGVVEMVPGARTEVFGYGGTYPGPTIVSRSGRRTVVRQVNQLGVPTVTHLHGGNTPSGSDGYPVDLVLPAGGTAGHQHAGGEVVTGSREYVYPMRQRAATLWYHDHRMDFTGPQVWRGLAGFHLVRDGEEDALPLPHGDRDVPLMIADRSFKADGSLWYPAADPTLREPGVADDYAGGVLGDVICVNGAAWPVLEVDAARYRLRILNASNARRYDLALDPPAPGGIVQIGSDGGLLAAPIRHDSIEIAPAERFDVVIDFGGYAPGTALTLVNRAGTGRTGQVMRFRVTRRVREDATVPAILADVPPLPPATGAYDRLWSFARAAGDSGHRGWLVNGQPFDPARTDADPRLGVREIWRIATDLRHPVHIHLSPFRVLSRNGGPPGRFDAGWKDTVDVRPGEYADVAVRFEQHRGRYLLHCHNLEHEDMGMMAAFQVR